MAGGPATLQPWRLLVADTEIFAGAWLCTFPIGVTAQMQMLLPSAELVAAARAGRHHIRLAVGGVEIVEREGGMEDGDGVTEGKGEGGGCDGEACD